MEKECKEDDVPDGLIRLERSPLNTAENMHSFSAKIIFRG